MARCRRCCRQRGARCGSSAAPSLRQSRCCWPLLLPLLLLAVAGEEHEEPLDFLAMCDDVDGQTAAHAADILRRRGYLVISGLARERLFKSALHLTARLHNTSEHCLACDGLTANIFSGYYHNKMGLFRPPGWPSSAAEVLLPRMHRDLKNVAQKLIWTLSRGHAILEGSGRQQASWFEAASAEMKTWPWTLRAMTYSASMSDSDLRARQPRKLPPLPGERWIGKPHQDVTWLTMVVQSGMPVRIRARPEDAWTHAGRETSDLEVFVWSGVRLHIASGGFFPAPCHGFSVGATPPPRVPEPDSPCCEQAAPEGARFRRISFVMLAPNLHCMTKDIPVVGCAFSWTPGMSTALSEECAKVSREPTFLQSENSRMNGRLVSLMGGLEENRPRMNLARPA